MADLTVKHTSRGFAVAEFRDRYGIQCSIQESSLAGEACLWLGAEPNRMHLTQDMAAALIPLLRRFAETGVLADG
ncbi:MAG TPA: hypothetical protein VJP88_08715 [Caulobacteraceae bacterium]|nr:hypothetical protein [Caulobacteraceae bacterium]